MSFDAPAEAYTLAYCLGIYRAYTPSDHIIALRCICFCYKLLFGAALHFIGDYSDESFQLLAMYCIDSAEYRACPIQSLP